MGLSTLLSLVEAQLVQNRILVSLSPSSVSRNWVWCVGIELLSNLLHLADVARHDQCMASPTCLSAAHCW